MTRTWHECELTSGQDLEALGDIDKLQTWLAGARAPLIDRIPMPDDRPWSFLPYPRHEQVGASVLWRWKQTGIIPKACDHGHPVIRTAQKVSPKSIFARRWRPSPAPSSAPSACG